MFVFDSVQESMVRNAYPDWVDAYHVCKCGYVSHFLPQDSDLPHDELCRAGTRWQWRPLAYDHTNGEVTTFNHNLVHYYVREPGQSSLRCSYCADAPHSPIHIRCTATYPIMYVEGGVGYPNMNQSETKCFELPMSPTEEFCEAHWLDTK